MNLEQYKEEIKDIDFKISLSNAKGRAVINPTKNGLYFRNKAVNTVADNRQEFEICNKAI